MRIILLMLFFKNYQVSSANKKFMVNKLLCQETIYTNQLFNSIMTECTTCYIHFRA